MRHTIEQQKQAMKQFVAIDSTTGFDNADRMKLELSEEMKRAERYKQPFVLSFFISIMQRNSNHYMEKRNAAPISAIKYQDSRKCQRN